MTAHPIGSTERIAALDVLRLIAALAVVFFHYFFRGAAADGYITNGYPEVASIAIYGYLGVNLFFLISGFVIAWSAEGRSWRDFAIARFARLYPGFIVCMTITFLVLLAAASPLLPVTFAQYVANLFMFAPALGQPFMDGVYWSIILEVVFYGWVAIALFFNLFDRFKLRLVAGWLAICLINEFWLQSEALRVLLVTEFGSLFAAGILFHHIWSRGRSSEALFLLATAFVISCTTMNVTRSWMLDHYNVAIPTTGLIVANIVIFALLAAAIWWRGAGRESAIIAALGGLTYPLYLLHQNLGYIAIERLAPMAGRWMAALLVIAMMLIVAWAIWRFVETPARRLTRNLLRALFDAIERGLARRRNAKVAR